MYVRAGRPAFARPCVGFHKSTSLMSSSLLLQQCPACLVRLTWIVFVIGGRWPYSWCLVGCCCQDLNAACNPEQVLNNIYIYIYIHIYIYVCVCVCVCGWVCVVYKHHSRKWNSILYSYAWSLRVNPTFSVYNSIINNQCFFRYFFIYLFFKLTLIPEEKRISSSNDFKGNNNNIKVNNNSNWEKISSVFIDWTRSCSYRGRRSNYSNIICISLYCI